MSVPWITSTHLFAASVHKIIATNTSLTVRGCECCFKRNWTEHEFEPWMVWEWKHVSLWTQKDRKKTLSQASSCAVQTLYSTGSTDPGLSMCQRARWSDQVCAARLSVCSRVGWGRWKKEGIEFEFWWNYVTEYKKTHKLASWQVDWDLSAQISMEKNEVEVHENRHLRPMICSHSSLLYLYRHCIENQDWRAHRGGLRFQSVSLLTHTHTHTFRIIFFSRQSQSCQCQMLICQTCCYCKITLHAFCQMLSPRCLLVSCFKKTDLASGLGMRGFMTA